MLPQAHLLALTSVVRTGALGVSCLATAVAQPGLSRSPAARPAAP